MHGHRQKMSNEKKKALAKVQSRKGQKGEVVRSNQVARSDSERVSEGRKLKDKISIDYKLIVK